MIKEEVGQLFEEQLNNWNLARNNYKALERVREKTLDVNGHRYKVQFNPARIVSSAAKVDPESIRERKCFLCRDNRPVEQKGIPFKEQYTILINPYPIFPQHLTIPALEHTPQLIASRLDDMLDLARQLDDSVVFYNGPKCGASAPDHFHFQAGNKGFLPIENDRSWEHVIRIESENKQDILDRFQQNYDALPLQPDDIEPMLNLLAWYGNGKWTTCLFPRKKHRPACYSAEGDANLLISPASVDMGGVFITPLEKDFEKITAKDIAKILDEV
jgi:ATP adenylyltransferase/5',5'''-P-1,P-4-tetraphosphate phosphorylase II